MDRTPGIRISAIVPSVDASMGLFLASAPHFPTWLHSAIITQDTPVPYDIFVQNEGNTFDY